jgi:hypothetical protein
MLWNVYPEALERCTLKQAQASLNGDPQASIPLLVWLLENPVSPIALPGAINLFGHDCMHLILKQGFSSAHEAYVVGFTMGNSHGLQDWHLGLIRFAARYLYPKKYRMNAEQMEIFDVGVIAGQDCPMRDLCKIDFQNWAEMTLQEIRSQIGLGEPIEVPFYTLERE